MKPTTFKADEVRMSAVAKGGLSMLSDEEFYMGEMMPAVNSMSGVGKFSATELKKQLSGKTASVQPSVENYASAMNGVLLAQGHRDDAPAALPQFHAAALRPERLRQR